MNSTAIKRFPVSPLLSVREVREYTGWGYDEANRICRVHGVRCGGKPKSPLYIHRAKLEAYLMSPKDCEPKTDSRRGPR